MNTNRIFRRSTTQNGSFYLLGVACTVMLLTSCNLLPPKLHLIDTSKTITSYLSEAQKCMDNELAERNIRDIVIAVDAAGAPTADANGNKATLAIMASNAISDMTNRSRAIKIVSLDDGFNAEYIGVGVIDPTYTNPNYTKPEYVLRVGALVPGSGPIGDRSIDANQDGTDLGLNSNNSSAQLDMFLEEYETTERPGGISSSNSVRVNSYDTSLSLTINNLSARYTSTSNIGEWDLGRVLVQHSVVEIIGKMFRIPYWECLEMPVDDDIEHIQLSWSENDNPVVSSQVVNRNNIRNSTAARKDADINRVVCGMNSENEYNLDNVGIITGGDGGTYIKIGKDICSLIAEVSDAIDIAIYSSPGSIANLYSVLRELRSQFGIVQSDILDVLDSCLDDFTTFCNFLFADKNNISKLRDRMRVVFPLYKEEVHVLVRKSDQMKDINDLKTKNIWVGSSQSGHFITANNMFRLLGLSDSVTLVTSEINSKIIDPIEALDNQIIDAVFYVGGQDIELFSDIKPEEYSEEFEFLATSDDRLNKSYNSSTLDSVEYEFMTNPVDTVSTNAMFMTYDYVSRISEAERGYEKEYFVRRHRQVCKTAELIENNLRYLISTGHKKWKDVDMNLPLLGWEVYNCSQ